MRNLVPGLVPRPELDEREREALHRDVVELRLLVRLAQVAGKHRDARDRRRLGHAPAVADDESVALLEAGDHRARRRRAAHEHALHRREVVVRRARVEQLQDPHPDRRHACGVRHAADGHVLEEAVRVEVRAGEDEPGAARGRDVRVAPRVRVEHRHDRQDHVLLAERQVDRLPAVDAERVQHRRAVRVHDALRPAGGAARVAHRRRLVLVELGRVPVVRVGRGKQLLVRILDDEHMLDLRLAAELLDQRR